MDMKDIEKHVSDTLGESANLCRDKDSSQKLHQNCMRMDLNSLITKNTKQNELLEKLTEKIDCLSEVIIKFHSKPGNR